MVTIRFVGKVACTDKFLQVLFPGNTRKLSLSDAPPRLPGLVACEMRYRCGRFHHTLACPVNRTRFLLNSRFYHFSSTAEHRVLGLLRKKLPGVPARHGALIDYFKHCASTAPCFAAFALSAKHVDPSTCSRKKVHYPGSYRWQFVAPRCRHLTVDFSTTPRNARISSAGIPWKTSFSRAIT